MLTKTKNPDLESMMDDLFSELSDDLAEVINGGVGNCHYSLIMPIKPWKPEADKTKVVR